MILDANPVFLLLGSNLGNREDNLNNAIVLINKDLGKIIAQSFVYETAAWGKTDQPKFLNIAVELNVNLKPLQLLNKILGIEAKLGRVRKEKWGERLIDIDIILYGNEIINIKDKLQIPHPEMQNRKFVMVPLVQIAPLFVHPIFKKTNSEILINLKDNLAVTKI